MHLRLISIFFILASFCPSDIWACTSAIVSAAKSANGYSMIWKHRDTSFQDNYVDSVKGSTPEFDYIALFNAADTQKAEAWAGVNRSGFAIINTVAGNLPVNADDCKDREGLIMSKALRSCRTVDDFQRLLDSLPRPMGVRTNFGVLDGNGDGAYFETNDYGYVRYNLNDSPEGYMIRSNYACSSSAKGGYGYERYDNAKALIDRNLANALCPEVFTEELSRNYFTAKGSATLDNSGSKKIRDGMFIPRPTSASSVVIELTKDGPVMWTMLGYPPAAITTPVTFDNIPENLKLNPSTGKSDAGEEANNLKRKMTDGKYIMLPQAKSISKQSKLKSLENYNHFRLNRK